MQRYSVFVAADWLVALLDSLSTRRKSGSKGMEIFFAVDEEEIGLPADIRIFPICILSASIVRNQICHQGFPYYREPPVYSGVKALLIVDVPPCGFACSCVIIEINFPNRRTSIFNCKTQGTS